MAVGTLSDATPVIVSDGSDNMVRIWDLDTDALYTHILGLDAEVLSLAVADTHIVIAADPCFIVAIPWMELCRENAS